MTDKISIMQYDTPGINTTLIKNCITDAVDGLASTSMEKYEHKATLIENATDMTTQEKLDALDGNYERHKKEIFEGIVIAIVFSLALHLPAIKRVLQSVA